MATEAKSATCNTSRLSRELHDLGKSPSLRDTGFHALDGARFLARRGPFPADVIALVAHHTGAHSEAIEHGLHRQLARMGTPDPTQLALLSAADLPDLLDRHAELFEGLAFPDA